MEPPADPMESETWEIQISLDARSRSGRIQGHSIHCVVETHDPREVPRLAFAFATAVSREQLPDLRVMERVT